jgi:gag-polypeptide of LTR copia-type
MVIKKIIRKAFQGIVSKSVTSVKEYIKVLKERFMKSDKAEITIFLINLITVKYREKGGIREHIIEMSNIQCKLKGVKTEIFDELLVHLSSYPFLLV